MKKITIKIKKIEKGSISIFVGIAMFAILGMGALITDLGLTYISSNEAQNAADAAAMAAGKDLPLTDIAANRAIVTKRAMDYAAANGILAGNTKVTIKSNGLLLTGVTVEVSKTTKGMLTRAADKTSSDGSLARRAIAQVAGVNSVTTDTVKGGSGSGVLPIAVTDSQISSLSSSGGYLNLSIDPSDISGSHFAWIVLNGSNGNANVLKNWMADGYDGKVSLGTIRADTGTKANLDDIYNARYLACINRSDKKSNGVTVEACPRASTSAPCTPVNYDPKCPRIAIVPVVRDFTGGGNGSYAQIIGFAQIFIENSSSGKMNAKFIKLQDDLYDFEYNNGTVTTIDMKLGSYKLRLTD